MKKNQILLAAILLIVCGAVYRLVPYPYRPLGFAPQLAMAVFGGAIVKDKKMAFALPLFSMLFSDALFQVLYMTGVYGTPGFYTGQATNYILIMSMTFIGMAMRKTNVQNIAASSIAAPVLYFLLSNFAVWAEHVGNAHPLTAAGLLQTYADGIPFFKGSLAATIAFNALFFGVWSLIQRPAAKNAALAGQPA